MSDTCLNAMNFYLPEDKYLDKTRIYHLRFIQWNRDGFGFYLITTYLNVQSYTRENKIPDGALCDPSLIRGIKPIFLNYEITPLLNYFLNKVSVKGTIDEQVSDGLFQLCGVSRSHLELTKDILKQA